MVLVSFVVLFYALYYDANNELIIQFCSCLFVFLFVCETMRFHMSTNELQKYLLAVP